MNFALISLGCPKNRVDADIMCRSLLDAGYKNTDKVEKADVVIVNTCGFIESAKQEAIDSILAAAAAKKQGAKLVVTGCLAQRYQSEVINEMPEIDAVVGIGSNKDIVSIIKRLAAEKALQCYGAQADLPLDAPRAISTPKHYAYLKIAEGCSNRCSYCAIPLIRGPLRSRPFDSIVKEAHFLAENGVKELIVVAQDITAYGEDMGELLLPKLLYALNGVEGIEWIRLLYAYPQRITNELVAAMNSCEKVLPYIDIPIQHINSEILTSMNRHGGREAVIRAVERLRSGVKNINIRTTLIVGYPGESEGQFEELYNFVKKYKFERLGCFAYSEEEDTPAAAMQQLPLEVRAAREEQIMRLQTDIMERKQKALIGTCVQVICDGQAEQGDGFEYVCRTAGDAPEIDGLCYVKSALPIAQGSIFTAKVVDAQGYDLFAQAV